MPSTIGANVVINPLNTKFALPTTEELQSLTLGHVLFLLAGLILQGYIIYRIIIDVNTLFQPKHYLRLAIVQISKVKRRMSIVRNNEKSAKAAYRTI